jgi:small neutral amino acid transporter SnatA (MarC family)
VAIFAMVALWVGELLLEILGLSTAALTVAFVPGPATF